MRSTAERLRNLNDRLTRATELTVHGVAKTFSKPTDGSSGFVRTVLDDVNFVFKAGAIVGMIGRTGVGKTTLGRIMGGLLRPDRGIVSFGDIDIFRRTAEETRLIRRWLRYVPQNPDAVLPSSITVAEALSEARNNSRLIPGEDSEWYRSIENTVLLDPMWAGRSVGDLSLGQRRRVVNLRSLQACPKFLILDEPFNGLDLETKRSMLKLLQTVSGERATGILFISHDVKALQEICDSVWYLESGKLLEYDT